MSDESWALGAVVVHQYYPGFVDLPPHTDYPVNSPGVPGLVRVVSHVRPLVVVDFNNELVNRPYKHRVHTDIKRPVRGINRGALSLDGRGREGRNAPIMAIENEVNGRTFRQDMFTSLEVRWEVYTERDAQAISPFNPLLMRFISTYRFLNPDTRLVLSDGIPDDSTPLRLGFYRYSEAERQLPVLERLMQAKVVNLKLSMLSYRVAARSLQDHASTKDGLAYRAKVLAGYLAAGFVLSDGLLEIERLANLAGTLKQPRAAVVEAMSMLELGLLAHQRKMLPALYKSGKLTRENEPTWKFLVDAILPSLLDLYDGDKGSVMKQAHLALQLRHKVAHGGHTPSADEVNIVLSCVRTILSIFDLPEPYKSNWKLKASATT